MKLNNINKTEAEKIGRDLFYDEQFFRDLERAETDGDIQRCLIDARHRWRFNVA